jgi:hypothetical protein
MHTKDLENLSQINLDVIKHAGGTTAVDISRAIGGKIFANVGFMKILY